MDYKTKSGKTIYPDGTIKDALRLDWGYWESKDTYDNLNLEIEKKLKAGYPDDNILFEDSQTVVLIQRQQETMRVSMMDIDSLDKLINQFLNYTRPEFGDFRLAFATFKEDLPTIIEILRTLIVRSPPLRRAGLFHSKEKAITYPNSEVSLKGLWADFNFSRR